MFQIALTYFLGVLFICMTSIYFGVCDFLVVFAKACKHKVISMEEQIESINAQTSGKKKSFDKLNKKLCQINLFYSDSIQLSQTKFSTFRVRLI